MLKEIDPAEYVEEANGYLRNLDFYAMFAILLSIMYLDGFESTGWQFLGTMLLYFACYFVSAVVTSLVWPVAALWLSRMNVFRGLLALSDPKHYPRTTVAFADGWWENRHLLGAFFLVFRVASVLALYVPLHRLLFAWWS